MNFFPANIYHIYNQGNNRQKIFYGRQDYFTFLSMYKQLVAPHLSTIAWCLMPNHFHFMVYTDERCNSKTKQGGIMLDPITNGIRKLLSGYTRIFNKEKSRTGSLFRQKTKSKSLSDIKVSPGESMTDYFISCFHYIHRNPLAAKLVQHAGDWEFSSFRDYAGLRTGKLCHKELAALYCDYRFETFIADSSIPMDNLVIQVIQRQQK